MPVNEYFAKVASVYDQRLQKSWSWQFIKQKEMDCVSLAFKGRTIGQTFLDLGSGTGTYASLITSLGGQVLCVDAVPQMNQIARAKGLEVICSSIEELQLKRRFDNVLATGSFEFVSDLKAAFRTVSLHLKEGGTFVLLYPRRGVSGFFYEKIHSYWGCPTKLQEHGQLRDLARSEGLEHIFRRRITLISELLVFQKS